MLYFLLDVLIDTAVIGSLIAYYFFNVHHFAIVNIINFLPFLIIGLLIYVLLSYVGLRIMVAEDKPAFRKIKNKFEKRSIFKKVYNVVTNVITAMLLIMTGHLILAVFFTIDCFIIGMIYSSLEDPNKVK